MNLELASCGHCRLFCLKPEPLFSFFRLDHLPSRKNPAENQNLAEDQKPTKPVTTLTQDDITKVIVQKIKANRSNNEKIGQLLKTYGVARVSDLPVSKYEAFITDLAAI